MKYLPKFVQLHSIKHSFSTPYSQIFKLPPATYLTIDLSSFEILSKNTYWDINSFVGNNDFESQTFESLFSKAVEKRCIADVQIGAFLSGGLDSTSVVKESKSFIKDIKTFSIGNTEEK